MNKALAVILLATTLDSVGMGLIFPILPELLRELTGSGEISALYGVILAGYAAMTFLFAPILGVLSDRFGRRPVLLLAMAGAVVDYLIMAFAPTLAILIVGRLVAGITAATLAVSTAYIADITPENQRARRFGYLYACFGLGFILGPAVGGALGEVWLRAPFLAAAAFNTLNIVLAFFFLKESRIGDAQNFAWRQINPFTPISWALKLESIRPLLVVYVAVAFIGMSYLTVWVLFSEDQFGWSMSVVGLSLAGYGFFQAGSQALLTEPITSWLGERRAFLTGLSFEMFALIVLSLAGQGWVAFALLPLFALGGIGEPVLQSLLTAKVSEEQQGQLQGVLTSLASLMAVFGPLFFAGLYGFVRIDWPGAIWLVVFILYLFVIPVIFMGRASWKPGTGLGDKNG